MKRIHRASALFAALIGALAFGLAGCGSEVAPTAPRAPAVSDAPLPSDLLGLDLGGLGEIVEGTVDAVEGTVSGVLSSLSLFPCETPWYGSVTKTIGRYGGTIKVGPHSLYIPPGALYEPVPITARATGGKQVKVDFEPHGLKFGRPAVLTLSYEHCTSRPTKPRIVYVGDDLKILEALPSIDDVWRRRVVGKLHHFSGYAFAD